VDPSDPNAHEGGGVRVLEGRAHRPAEPRAVNDEVGAEDEGQGGNEDEDAQGRDAERSERQGRRREWVRDGLGDAAPDQQLGVLHGDPEADHDQHDGIDRLPPQRSEEHQLGEGAEDHAGGHGHGERADEGQAAQRHRRERRVGAQRIELAVGEVHDVHEAEDQGQPDPQ